MAQRVWKGGHDVPKDKIISRYYKMLDLISDVIDVSGACYIYDNSTQSGMTRIFKKRKEEYFYRETDYWSWARIEDLTKKRKLVRKEFKD